MADTTAATLPPGVLYAQAAQHRQDLEARTGSAVDAMLVAHAAVYWHARAEHQALLEQIREARESGARLSPAWLYQRKRLSRALDVTKSAMGEFAEHATFHATSAQRSAIQAGVKHHARMGRQAVAETPGLATLAGTFLDVDPRALEYLVGFQADGSPLADVFSRMATEVADQVKSALVLGVSLGWSVDRMTRAVDQALDMPRWRAETIIRTEAMRAYRATARDTYVANRDVLAGWTWVATMDRRLCPACLVMDGTEHPVEATLDGHPRCRCAMVPRTKSWDEIVGEATGIPDTRPPVRSGPEWFAAQPPEVQRALLGPAKYAAWKAGEISLEDVVARTEDPAWGTMRRERSLVEISRGRNANWQDA